MKTLFLSLYLGFLPVFLLSHAAAPAGEKKPPEKKADLSKLEGELLKLTNEERKKSKLPPLQPQSQLMEAAHKHSAQMAQRQELAHILDGKNPDARVAATGYKFDKLGENVGGKGKVALKDLVRAWMGSPVHRDNILGEQFTEIGLGVVQEKNGVVWVTQVFARPAE